MDAQTASWVEWIDGRIDGWIEQEKDAILEAVGEGLAQLLDKASADTQRALDKRDRELEGLRREIKLLRDEVGLERGLAKLKTEVAQARREAPSFRSELEDLREQVAKQEKTIVRLRGEASGWNLTLGALV